MHDNRFDGNNASRTYTMGYLWRIWCSIRCTGCTYDAIPGHTFYMSSHKKYKMFIDFNPIYTWDLKDVHGGLHDVYNVNFDVYNVFDVTSIWPSTKKKLKLFIGLHQVYVGRPFFIFDIYFRAYDGIGTRLTLTSISQKKHQRHHSACWDHYFREISWMIKKTVIYTTVSIELFVAD